MADKWRTRDCWATVEQLVRSSGGDGGDTYVYTCIRIVIHKHAASDVVLVFSCMCVQLMDFIFTSLS